MEMVPMAYSDYIKRWWRRRRYQRLDDATKTKKKVKIARFGGKRNQHGFNIKKVSKFRLTTFLSPFKVVAKFHEAYVDAMVSLSEGKKKIQSVAVKRVPKGQPASLLLVSAPNNEMVDIMRAVQIYNRVVSTRQQLV